MKIRKLNDYEISLLKDFLYGANCPCYKRIVSGYRIH